MSNWDPANAEGGAYTLYNTYAEKQNAATIDNSLSKLTPLLAKGEAAMGQLVNELSSCDPGELDQSRLMAAQLAMSRWQSAAQLISNFLSGITTGLKNTVQNVGR